MANISIRHPQIFRLTAGITAQQMRIAEQTSGRIAPQLLSLVEVAVRPVAPREKTTLAKEALAAGNSERDNDTVADLQFAGVGADLYHFSHRLVADDVAMLHAGHDAVVDMQV